LMPRSGLLEQSDIFMVSLQSVIGRETLEDGNFETVPRNF
jgi:hypothetical protein